MRYIWQQKEWPKFRWKIGDLVGQLSRVRHQQGRLLGRMEALGFPWQEEAVLHTLTEDVMKSSEIEGEILDKDQVRSSIARRLGLDVGGLIPADRNVEGIVEMMLDATQRYREQLTQKRLFAWHGALFQTAYSGMRKIRVAKWRDDSDGPMQVVCGPIGREKVHYEAPPAKALAQEMKQFLKWFEADEVQDPVLKAAVAHLWFVTIHPFEDGNGRIARAVADMALARSDNTAQRFYSMSARIRAERKDYYDMLEKTQKGDLDITPWLTWFLACLQRALASADEMLGSVIDRAEFWKRHADIPLNERQRKVLLRFLNNFEGKLTSSKWAALAKTSQDTASRDIADLIAKGILVKDIGGGRSTSYSLHSS